MLPQNFNARSPDAPPLFLSPGPRPERKRAKRSRPPRRSEKPLQPGQLAGEPCRHLGALLEERKGTGCTNKGATIPIHECAQHGTCSPCRKAKGVELCRYCPDWAAISANPPTSAPSGDTA